MSLGISASTFRTARRPLAWSKEMPARRRDRGRISSRVATAVTSSVQCSIFEKRSSPPKAIFSASVRSIFRRSAVVRLVIDRTVFASPPASCSACTNNYYYSTVVTKIRRNQSIAVYSARRFLRTSYVSTKHLALFPRIKVRQTSHHQPIGPGFIYALKTWKMCIYALIICRNMSYKIKNM